jgi:hypothetical protein
MPSTSPPFSIAALISFIAAIVALIDARSKEAPQTITGRIVGVHDGTRV